MLYKYNGVLCSLKEKEIMSYATNWINLEDIMLNVVSQPQKDKYCKIPFI